MFDQATLAGEDPYAQRMAVEAMGREREREEKTFRDTTISVFVVVLLLVALFAANPPIWRQFKWIFSEEARRPVTNQFSRGVKFVEENYIPSLLTVITLTLIWIAISITK